MVGESEFFPNSSTMLMSIVGIYQSVEILPRLAKWKCSQGQLKMEDKIKNENTDSPKHLPGFVAVAIKERLSIQRGCLWGGRNIRSWACV